MNIYSLLKKTLFMIEPERAHAVSLASLKTLYRLGLVRLFTGNIISSPVTVMNIEFPNPVGLAAGLDKNGDYIDELTACGFGFLEIGTVTPVPQHGNQKPRLFRLVNDQAIINRMGFNNKGVKYLVDQVRKSKKQCVLGINIGKNKNTPLDKAVDDYIYSFTHVYPYADYVTINISSPNTPGLRDLQHGDELDKLLATLKTEQKKMHEEYGRYVPLVVKIAPDLNESEVSDLVDAFVTNNIDGVIATNTTNDRPELVEKDLSSEAGGLSGRPLSGKSDHVLKLLSDKLKGRIPIIAVGGIMKPEDAQRKMELGASLVQIYTGFIYSGPALIRNCVMALSVK